MSLSILLERLIRYGSYALAMWFFFEPGIASRFGRVYRLFLAVLTAALLLATTVGLQLNTHDRVVIELLNATVVPAGLGLCGFLAGYRLSRNAAALLGVAAMCVVFAYIATMLFGIRIPGGLINRESTLMGYMVSFMAPLGLWLLSEYKLKWLARFITGGAWLSALFSLQKWNVATIIFVPLIWATLEGKGPHVKVWRLFWLTGVALLGVGIVSGIDYIAASSTGGTFDEYLDHHFRERIDPSSGRFDMWREQLDNLLVHPVLGIGFGSQALGLDVEDHNLYVFYLTRFGFPLGSLVLITLLGSGRVLLKLTKKGGRTNHRIALLLVGNFAFISAVGEGYTLTPVMAVVATVGALLMQNGLFAQAASRQKSFLKHSNARYLSSTRLSPGGVGDKPAPASTGPSELKGPADSRSTLSI